MKPDRPLTSEELSAWRAFAQATHALFDQLDRELQRDAGMSHAYYVILARLSEAPGRAMRMSDLAERSQSSRSRLSHAVARLEEKGWVRRERCPTDRRGTVAVLTDAGFAALAAAAPGHVAGVREHVFNHMTPAQVEHLGAISEALLAHLRSLGDLDARAGREPAEDQPAGRR